MKVFSRLITGGLVGFAVVLAILGHSQWIAHALAAGLSMLAVLFASVGEHKGRRANWWLVVPPVALVAVYFYSWWT